MEESSKNKTFSKEELSNLIYSSGVSDVAFHKKINTLISNGDISRIGRGNYVFNGKRQFSYQLQSECAKSLLNDLSHFSDSGVLFDIYETTIMNEFLNHLIARPTIIIEVEKSYVDSVFWFLKEKGIYNILLEPTEKDNYLYNTFDGRTVIVKRLVSFAPINKKNHSITIEKLIVDLVCDKTINLFYQGNERIDILGDILVKYSVKFDTVRNYAKRRHCFKQVVSYMPDEYKEYLDDKTNNIYKRKH